MADRLQKYKNKRNFKVTSEPDGDGGKAEKHELRFVIQHHLARRDHFDFRLEWKGALLSWAVPKGASYNPADKRLAVRVEDHPLEYRNFEGVIPKGEYGGGTVMLWDEGTWLPKGSVSKSLKEGSLKFTLFGVRLKGDWTLVRLKNEEKQENWLLIKERDEFAKESEGTNFSRSVRTGRTMTRIAREEAENEIEDRTPNDNGKALNKKSVLEKIESEAETKIGTADKNKKGAEEKTKVDAAENQTENKKPKNRKIKNPFSSVNVQLASLVSAVPEEEDWLYETKYDGYRIVAYCENGICRLASRNNGDYTEKFSAVAQTLQSFLGETAVLDGEMAVADKNGGSDFQALQRYVKNPKGNLVYIVFDLLALDGKDLRMLPIEERKNRLEKLLDGAPDNIRFSRHVKGYGKESFSAACGEGMEGIVGKRAGSVYSGTRNGDWIKIKCGMRQEFVVCGYTRTAKQQAGLSALLLGVYDKGRLIYSGRAGTGFDKTERDELALKFKKLLRKTPPVENPPEARAEETVFWLKPELVAEIKFAEWTKENQLRQASFKGLRTDKNSLEVVRETERQA